MTDPLYKPEHWITYKTGNAGGYGKIVGASFNGASWVYSVAGPLLDTTYFGVQEADITAVFENNSWLAPRQNGGGDSGGSAYTDTTPSL